MVNEAECIFDVYVSEVYIFVCVVGVLNNGSDGLDMLKCVSHWPEAFLDVM